MHHDAKPANLQSHHHEFKPSQVALIILQTHHTISMSTPAQNFPRFLELPNELQIQIFQQAILSCPGEQELGRYSFVFLEPTSLGRSAHLLTSPYHKKIIYGHKFVAEERAGLYSLMRACRLSRQIVLEWWLEKVERSHTPYSKEKIAVRAAMLDVLDDLLREMKS